MKNLKSVVQRAAGDRGENGKKQRTILCSEVKMIGCLFNDMMRYHGQSGCREKGCHCPLSGSRPEKNKRTH